MFYFEREHFQNKRDYIVIPNGDGHGNHCKQSAILTLQQDLNFTLKFHLLWNFQLFGVSCKLYLIGCITVGEPESLSHNSIHETISNQHTQFWTILNEWRVCFSHSILYWCRLTPIYYTRFTCIPLSKCNWLLTYSLLSVFSYFWQKFTYSFLHQTDKNNINRRALKILWKESSSSSFFIRILFSFFLFKIQCTLLFSVKALGNGWKISIGIRQNCGGYTNLFHIFWVFSSSYIFFIFHTDFCELCASYE